MTRIRRIHVRCRLRTRRAIASKRPCHGVAVTPEQAHVPRREASCHGVAARFHLVTMLGAIAPTAKRWTCDGYTVQGGPDGGRSVDSAGDPLTTSPSPSYWLGVRRTRLIVWFTSQRSRWLHLILPMANSGHPPREAFVCKALPGSPFGTPLSASEVRMGARSGSGPRDVGLGTEELAS